MVLEMKDDAKKLLISPFRAPIKKQNGKSYLLESENFTTRATVV